MRLIDKDEIKTEEYEKCYEEDSAMEVFPLRDIRQWCVKNPKAEVTNDDID